MAAEPGAFGEALGQARQHARLSRRELAQRVGLDASYIHRLETGKRSPSREVALALAEALGVGDEALPSWLAAAGHAPTPLLPVLRAAARTRGGARGIGDGPDVAGVWDAAISWQWMEAMGLEGQTLAHLLQAMGAAKPAERQEAARVVRAALERVAEALEAPVRTAVIPAAGGEHQFVAPHVMQRLLLRAVGEAASSGITRAILILAPGARDALYTPLRDALRLAVIPSVRLEYVEQNEPGGLGNAILQTEDVVGNAPFAVLLPDDVVHEQVREKASSRQLHRMMQLLRLPGQAAIVAVAPISPSEMPRYGVVRLLEKERVADRAFVIQELIEKPARGHQIRGLGKPWGVVGRYLLSAAIFRVLHELADEHRHPLHLTDALERLRQTNYKITAFVLEAARQDVGHVVGELLEQASELNGDTSSDVGVAAD